MPSAVKSLVAAANSLQLCPTLCDPRDGSPSGSAVPGILQARTLEWVAISFSSAWKWKVKVKSISRVWLFVTPWTAAYQAPQSMGFSRQEYWSGVPLPSPVKSLSYMFKSKIDTFIWYQHITQVVEMIFSYKLYNKGVQLSSVAQSCPTLCDPMNHSTPGLPVHQQLPEFTQTHVHWVCDAIQPFHLLSSLSPPAPNPSQHQGLFPWVNSSHEVAKVLEFQLQHQSFQWTPRTDLL